MRILSRHFLGKGTTVVYPHSNGFSADGRHLYLAAADSSLTTLLQVDLATLESRPVACFGSPARGESALWHDVALRSGRIAAVFDNAAWVLDIPRDSALQTAPFIPWQKVYEPEAGSFLHGLPSLCADGSRLLVGQSSPASEGNAAQHCAVQIDIASDSAVTLFCKEWLANHFHYCPHDEQWIGFSHEGLALEVMDRCWVWHPQLAPSGRCVFDQHAAALKPEHPLSVGHERWNFHDASAHVVAYAVSPGGRRGLWEAFTDGRAPRLLWENNSIWHCNSDASGTIIALDTSGDWQRGEPGRDVQGFAEDVARHLKADAQRTPNTSDIVVLDLKQGKALPVATVTRTRHPWHPHPALSQDGRWLVYNDASEPAPGAWLVELDIDE